MTTLKPTGNKVLLRPLDPPEKAGEIFLPTSHYTADRYATVIAVGSGKPNPKTGRRTPPPLQVGDTVLLGGAKGEPLDINGVFHVLYLYEELRGVLTP